MGHAVRDKSTARCWICPRVHAARRVCDKSGREGRIWADLHAQGRIRPPPPSADRTPPPPRPDPTPAAKAGSDPPGRRDRTPAGNTCAFPGTLDKPSRLFRPKHPGPDVLGKLNPPARAFRVLQVSDRPLRSRARLLPLLSCLYSCATEGGARGPQRLIVCETGRRSPGFCSWTLVGQAPGVIKEHGGPPRTVL